MPYYFQKKVTDLCLLITAHYNLNVTIFLSTN
jgi:hypothetical protein